MASSKKILAAIKIQKATRGYLTRKKFGIKHLNKPELNNHHIYLIGNDPKIKGLKEYAAEESRTVLIGTSGLRVLSLLCELSSKKYKPKLIVVGNCQQVIEFWRKFRDLTTKDNSEKDIFLKKFYTFLSKNGDLYKWCSKECEQECLEQEINKGLSLLKEIFNKHGFDYVKSTIKNAAIIAGSWADEELFSKIKNILIQNKYGKVFAYPSNIANCVSTRDSIKIIKNLKTLNPDLTIMTDLGPHRISENYFLIPKIKFCNLKNSEQKKRKKPILNRQDNKKKQKIDISKKYLFYSKYSHGLKQVFSYPQDETMEEQQFNPSTNTYK